jgi:hypothetical protein
MFGASASGCSGGFKGGRTLCRKRERNPEVSRPGFHAGVMQVKSNLQSPSGTKFDGPAIFPGHRVPYFSALSTDVKK